MLLLLLSRFSHLQLFATPMTVALQASLVCRILQARILEWLAMLSSRGSSRPRDRNMSLMSPALAGGFSPLLAPGKPHT